MAKDLEEKVEGVLLFPSVVKAGFKIGGEYGEGVLRVKSEKGEISSSPNMSYTSIY